MRSNRLKYRFPSRAYTVARWPSFHALFPTQLSPEVRQLSLYDCCLMAGLSSPSYTRKTSGFSHRAVRAVAKGQMRLMRTNAYHNHAHVAQVILAAGLLADAAEIGQMERDILILAALIHDYGHLGAHRNKTDFWQEYYSCDKAIPRLIKGGMDSRLSGLLYEMVYHTSPKANAPDSFIKGNDCLSLLLDADLFASLFLPKRQVDWLTAKLKYEDRLLMSVADLRNGFLQICAEKGFASLAGQRLHDALAPHMTYFPDTTYVGEA